MTIGPFLQCLFVTSVVVVASVIINWKFGAVISATLMLNVTTIFILKRRTTNQYLSEQPAERNANKVGN